jgi:DnaJ-class molecular chaperone
MDRCSNCIATGNVQACREADCGFHELWIVTALEAEIAVRDERDAKVRDFIKDFGWIECPTCNGRGYIEHHYDGPFSPPSPDVCPECDGCKKVLCEEAEEALALLGGDDDPTQDD